MCLPLRAGSLEENVCGDSLVLPLKFSFCLNYVAEDRALLPSNMVPAVTAKSLTVASLCFLSGFFG